MGGRVATDFLETYSGPCGDFKYIFIGNLGGTIEYFDASGVLLAAERYNDVPGYCDDTSFNNWCGPIPDCMRDPWNIWENFCKGSGYAYCASVSECGSVDFRAGFSTDILGRLHGLTSVPLRPRTTASKSGPRNYS